MRKEMKTENEETRYGRRETDECQEKTNKKTLEEEKGETRGCWWTEFKAGGAKWDMQKKKEEGKNWEKEFD